MKSEVVILSCESYEEELVYSTLKKGNSFTRGMGNFPEKRRKDSAEQIWYEKRKWSGQSLPIRQWSKVS